MNNADIRASQQELHKTLKELSQSVASFAADVKTALNEIDKSVKELSSAW